VLAEMSGDGSGEAFRQIPSCSRMNSHQDQEPASETTPDCAGELNSPHGGYIFETQINIMNYMHLKNLVVVLAASLIAASSLVAVGNKPDASKLPAPASQQDLTYANIKPMLQASCLKCHGEEKPKSKYRVDSREALVKGGDSENAAVVPGKSAESPVIYYVSDLVADMEMPPPDKRDRFPALTKEQISLFRAWIDQGAK